MVCWLSLGCIALCGGKPFLARSAFVDYPLNAHLNTKLITGHGIKHMLASLHHLGNNE